MTIQKKPITDTYVTSAKRGTETQDEKQPMLRLRVSPKGKKVWLYYGHNPLTGKPKKAVLGLAEGPGSLTPKEARAAADEMKVETTKAKPGKPGAVPTFNDLIPDMSKPARTQIERHLGDWLDKRLNQITIPMVEQAEARILRVAGDRQRYRDELGGKPQRVKPGAYAVTLTAVALRTAYHLAAKRRVYGGENMGLHMSKTRIKARKIVFKNGEAERFLAALDDASLGSWVKDFFLLTHWTLARWGNVKSMRWDELDLNGSEPTWTIPAVKFKGRESHTIPLIDEATVILKKLLSERVDNCPWVFPSPSGRGGHLMDVTYQWYAVKKIAQLGDFTIHDIRRSGASKLAEKYPLSVVQQILGHKDPKTTASYYINIDNGIKREAMRSRA